MSVVLATKGIIAPSGEVKETALSLPLSGEIEGVKAVDAELNEVSELNGELLLNSSLEAEIKIPVLNGELSKDQEYSCELTNVIEFDGG